MRDLISEYRRSLRKTGQMLRRAEYPNDRALLGGMISDLKYAIEWMSTGRMPGSRRGIERRAAYQRETLMDPQRIEQVFLHDQKQNRECNSLDSKVQEVLAQLTDREREVYVMCKGRGVSRTEAANMLGISKGAVNSMLLRAQRKIENWRESQKG